MYASDYILSILKHDVKYRFTTTSSPSLSSWDGGDPLLNGMNASDGCTERGQLLICSRRDHGHGQIESSSRTP